MATGWIALLSSHGLDLPPDNDLKRAAEHELAFHADPERLIMDLGETRLGLPLFRPSVRDRSQCAISLAQIDLSVYQTSIDGELPGPRRQPAPALPARQEFSAASTAPSSMLIWYEEAMEVTWLVSGLMHGSSRCRNFTLQLEQDGADPALRYSVYSIFLCQRGVAPGYPVWSFVLMAEGGRRRWPRRIGLSKSRMGEALSFDQKLRDGSLQKLARAFTTTRPAAVGRTTSAPVSTL